MYKYHSQPIFTVAILVLLNACGPNGKENLTVNSPDKRIKLSLETSSEGGVNYSVQLNDTVVIEKSELGLILAEGDYDKSLTLKSVSKQHLIQDDYSL